MFYFQAKKKSPKNIFELKSEEKKMVTEQAHCPKPNINPKQQMRNQTQSKEEKKNHKANPTDGSKPTDSQKKKKKKTQT